MTAETQNPDPATTGASEGDDNAAPVETIPATADTGAAFFARLGITPPREVAVVVKRDQKKKGGFKNYTLSPASALRSPVEADAIYIASGAFAPGTLTRYKGRARDNVERVLWQGIDVDLKAYIAHRDGITADEAEAHVHGMEDDALADAVADLRGVVEAAIQEAGLPAPSAWAYSGYGLYCWWAVPAEVGADVKKCRAANARIIALLNAAAGYACSDNVGDCGTRIYRLPGTLNLKNVDHPRRARFLDGGTGAPITGEDIEALANPPEAPEAEDAPAAKPAKAVKPIRDAMPGTDAHGAAWLIEHHGEHLAYVRPWGAWYVYNPELGIWERDDNARTVLGLAFEYSQHLTTLHAEAATAHNADATKHLNGAILRYFQSRNVQGIVTAASTAPGLHLQYETLDATRDYLVTGNGTVDLRAGTLHGFLPDLFATRRTPVVYDPTATCQEWERFIERILPDAEIRACLQTAVGMAATGRSERHLFFILFGNGRNGKGSFVEAVAHSLGIGATGYADTVSSALFVDSGSAHPTIKATLHNLRLAYCDELPEDGKLREDTVKTLTGGDRINCHRMREDDWSFAPTHTLFVSTNSKPKIKGRNRAIWERIALIPFTVDIPEDELDPTLRPRLRENETTQRAILRWIVDGAIRYCREGLHLPDAVKAARDAYRDEENPLREFLEDYCTIDPEEVTPRGTVFDAYCRYAEAAKIKHPWTQQGLTRALAAEGFRTEKIMRNLEKGKYVVGLTIT